MGNNVPPRTGSFEVTINFEKNGNYKKLVYSKFDNNRFPNDNEILNWIDSFNN